MATDLTELFYGTAFPVELYYRVLEEARGKVRALRVGDEKDRLIKQKLAQCYLTSGDPDWYDLCEQCGFRCTDKLLAVHRAEFGIVTLVDFFRFVMKLMNWSVEELEEHIDRAYLYSLREETE
jgi:hypothetical protein